MAGSTAFAVRGDAHAGCELCQSPGGVPVASGADWRVIRVADADFPAFYRVVWHAHTAEFTDLDSAARHRCIDVVAAVESALRAQLSPTKVNLATLGNMVAHLHWHVIARFDWDSHFPQPVWGARQRDVAPGAVSRLAVSLDALDATVRAAVAGLE